MIHKDKCIFCGRNYKGKQKEHFNQLYLKQKKLAKIKLWIMKNVKKGTYLLIGRNFRKVLSINGTTIVLKKIVPTGYHNDTTTYVFADYYKKLQITIRN